MSYLDDFKKKALSGPNADIDYVDKSVSKINELASVSDYSLSYFGDPSKYSDYGLTINRFTTPEELDKQINKIKADNQSGLEQFGNLLAQVGISEVILGTAIGFSNLFDIIKAAVTDDEMFKNDSELTKYLQKWQDESREKFAIYRQNPDETFDFSDFGWWMDNMVTIGSTASLLLPAWGVGKGLSFAGKTLRLNKALNYTTRGFQKTVNAVAKNRVITHPNLIAREIGAGTEIFNSALASRVMENYQEGSEVYRNVKENALFQLAKMSDEEKQELIKHNPNFANLSNNEIAEYIAGESGNETFWNDMYLIALDIAQFKGISRMSKGLRASDDSYKVWKAKKDLIKGFGKQGEDAIEKTGWKGVIKDRLQYAYENSGHVLEKSSVSEMIEEGYQGIQSEKGEEVYRKAFDPNYTERTLESYLTDLKIWEQGFWGMVGGLAFGRIAHGLKRGEDYYNAYQYKKNNTGEGKTFSEIEYNRIKLGEQQIQLTNIEKMRADFDNFKNEMQSIQEGNNPYEYKISPISGEISRDDQDKDEKLKAEEIDAYKEHAINKFVTNLALEATQSGNGDILEELIQSKEFIDAYNKVQGIDVKTDNLENTILSKIRDVKEVYYKSLDDVIENIERYNKSFDKTKVLDANEFVMQNMATRIALSKLDIAQIDKNINLYDKLINEELQTGSERTNPYIQEYIDTRMAMQLKAQIDELYKLEEKINKQAKDNIITEQGKQDKIKELNRQRELLRNKLPLLSKMEIDSQVVRDEFQDDKSHTFGTFASRFQEWYNENITDEKVEQYVPKNQIQKYVDNKIYNEVLKSLVSANIPVSNTDFREYYEEQYRHMDKYVNDRFFDALDIVQDYLTDADNLEDAFNKLIEEKTGNKKVQDAFKATRIYYANDPYLQSMYEAIKKARENKKEKENTVETNGEKNDKDKAKETVATVKKDIEQKTQTVVTLTGEQISAEEKDALEHLTADPQKTSREEDDIDKLYNNASIDKQNNQLARLAKTIADKKRTADKISMSTLIDNTHINYTNLVNYTLNSIKESLSLGEIDFGGGDTVYLGNEADIEKCVKEGIQQIINLYNLYKKKNNKLAEAIQTTIDVAYSTAEDVISDDIAKEINNVIAQYIAERKYSRDKVNVDKLFLYLIENGYPRLVVEQLVRQMSIVQDNINIEHTDLFNDLKNDPTNYLNTLLQKESLSKLNAEVNPVKGITRFEGSIINSNEENLKAINEALLAYKRGEGKLKFEIKQNRVKSRNIGIKIIFDDGKKQTELGFNIWVDRHADDNSSFGLQVQTWNKYGQQLTYNTGFIYQVSFKDNQYESNVDNLFIPLIEAFNGVNEHSTEQEKQNVELLKFIQEYYDNNDKITEDVAKEFFKFKLIQDLNSDEPIYGYGDKDIDGKIIRKSETEKAKMLINDIGSILITGMRNDGINTNENADEARASYENWIAKLFNDFTKMYELQTVLKNNPDALIPIITDEIYTYIVRDTEKTHALSEYNLVKEQNNSFVSPLQSNPIVVIKDNRIHIEGRKESIPNVSNRTNGYMGIMMIDHQDNPQIGWFSYKNGQKLGNSNTEEDTKLRAAVEEELMNLIKIYTQSSFNNEMTWEELGKRIGELLGGRSYKNGRKGLFLGIDCHVGDDFIGIDFGDKKYRDKDNTKQAYSIMLFRQTNAKNRRKEASKTILVYNNDTKEYNAIRKPDDEKLKTVVNAIVQNLQYNASFVMFEDGSYNRYIQKTKDGKLQISFDYSKEKFTYDSFTEYVLKHNAFKLDIAVDKNGNFAQSDQFKQRSSPLYVAAVNNNFPVESNGINTNLAKALDNTNEDGSVNVKEVLMADGHTEETVDVLSGKNAAGLNLLEKKVVLDRTDNGNENAKYNGLTDVITITNTGYQKVITVKGQKRQNYKNKDLLQLLLHENLHGRIRELHLMDRKDVIDNLMKIYNEVRRLTLEEDENNPIRTWFDSFNIESFTRDNHLEGKSQETIKAKFAEEFLIESLTQRNIIDYLRNHEYNGEELNLNDINKNKKTSIWDKIVDIILKIFNIERLDKDTKSILANELSILRDAKKSKSNSKNKSKQNKNEETNITNPQSAVQTQINFDEPQTNDTPIVDLTNNDVEDIELDLENADFDSGLSTSTVRFDDEDTPVYSYGNDDKMFSTTEDVQMEIPFDTQGKTTDEVAVESVKKGTNLNVANTEVVPDMQSYLDTYDGQDKLYIANCLANGEFTYIC